MELWKPITDRYDISSYGRCRNKTQIIKPYKHSNGYITYTLHINKKRKKIEAHRLVAQAFIDNPENKPSVNHIDGNKHNNNVNNLEWATHKENATHSIRVLKNPKPPKNFLGNFGKYHNRSKNFVIKTRNNKIEKYNSGLEMARKYNFDSSIISYIKNKYKLPYTIKRGFFKGFTLLSFNDNFGANYYNIKNEAK